MSWPDLPLTPCPYCRHENVPTRNRCGGCGRHFAQEKKRQRALALFGLFLLMLIACLLEFLVLD
jgi:hypothetical protein